MHQPLPRIRVDRLQLDHSLSFITNPHLVQDLPFGQKTLKLSSGQLIEVPNVHPNDDTPENCTTIHPVLPRDGLQTIQ